MTVKYSSLLVDSDTVILTVDCYNFCKTFSW